MRNINMVRGAMLVLLSLSTLIARAQNTDLSGQLKGLSAKKVTILYNGEHKADTLKVTNGNFTWKANIDGPQQVMLFIGYKDYLFFVQPGHIKLTGLKDSVQTFKITGSRVQQESEAFNASVKDLTKQEEALYPKYGKGTAEEQTAVEEKLAELTKQKQVRAERYIAVHPKNPYSVYLVADRASYGSDYSEVKPLYDKLDASIKQSAAGKKLAQRLEVLAKGRIGAKMVDFTKNDTTGNPVKFSDFKDKYVLVDFWASWCGPCRGENPNVLKAYNEFKDKGFTVIGISLDSKASDWKKAIQEDKMPWTEVSDLKGGKDPLADYFGIEGIPSNLLIDPSGKIVGKDLRGVSLEKKLKELLD